MLVDALQGYAPVIYSIARALGLVDYWTPDSGALVPSSSDCGDELREVIRLERLVAWWRTCNLVLCFALPVVGGAAARSALRSALIWTLGGVVVAASVQARAYRKRGVRVCRSSVLNIEGSLSNPWHTLVQNNRESKKDTISLLFCPKKGCFRVPKMVPCCPYPSKTT